MKSQSKSLLIATACLLVSMPLTAGKNKTNSESKVVDEGTFAVMVNGERVATETFNIRQNAQGSLSKSELKLKNGKAAQNSEMAMADNGNLIKYEWNDLETPKGKNVVEPSNEFLVEHYGRPDGKTGDQPFLMPASSVILEDFFFSHRELLLWRYLGSSCAKNGPSKCEFGKAQYGAIIPRQRISSMVTVEFVGTDNVPVKGVPTDLTKFRITTEGPDWFVWLDSHYKVQKIAVPETSTEVTRE